MLTLLLLRPKYCGITWSIPCLLMPWAPSQYPKRRLFLRSRKVSKPRDWYFKWSYRFEMWQAHRQHCCRSACQISERSDNSNYKSRGFETSRDLTERRIFGYWDGALAPCVARPSTAVVSIMNGTQVIDFTEGGYQRTFAITIRVWRRDMKCKCSVHIWLHKDSLFRTQRFRNRRVLCHIPIKTQKGPISN